jgi:hypothetical protein
VSASDRITEEWREQDLNDLGREGWEALSTLAPSYGQGQAIEIAVMLKKAYA